jgi:prepilin-type N-terminal cleavage/methylation domain-containing protein
MNKKKGFTLIELLAIIVILAIIAVITVPIILNIIEESKKGAAKDSAYGYKDSINKYYTQELLNNQNLKLNDTYTVTNGTLSGGSFGDENVTSFPIQVSGTAPSSGSLTYENNVLIEGCLVIGDYKVTFDRNETSTTKGTCIEQYGYTTLDYDSWEETTIAYGTSGYAVTGKNVYLKYALTNGQVATGTIPEACIYSESFPLKELCLKNDDSYETSVQKIKTYFGYNESTWIEDNINSEIRYSDQQHTIECSVDENNMPYGCGGGADGVGVDITYGDSKIAFVQEFTCYLFDNGTAYFD